MSYDAMRHFADSYGLLFMLAVFVIFVGWTFRRGAREDHHRAATSIFEEDRRDG